MRILLSAFECRPHSGSEPGLGWAWAETLAQMGHEVWVITQAECQQAIEPEMVTNPISKLHFLYHKYHRPQLRFKNTVGVLLRRLEGEQRQIYWQWEAYQIAKTLSEQVTFDCVHHVTNTSIRRPSFMGLLGIPFIFGPLAGGVKAPMRLRNGYPPAGWWQDFSRDLANNLISFRLLMHLSFAKASKIFCDSEQTQALIPKLYRSKTQVLFCVPTPKFAKIPNALQRKQIRAETFKVLFVGRTLPWKGLHLALKSFAKLNRKVPTSRFKVIGKDTPPKWLSKVVKQERIDNVVAWIGWMKQEELICDYLEHDVLLFPSLHDSIGQVVTEALCCGLPVICLDLGGPGVMVDHTCGRVIGTDRLEEEAVIKALSDALLELAENPALRQQLSEGALARVSKFDWKKTVEQIYLG